MTQTAGARRRRPYAARVPVEERREQLLDATLGIILRDGYAAVSMDAIAREVGVTRPVVYGAFDRLGVLLGALLDRQQERAFGQLMAALPTLEELAEPDGLDLATRRLVRMLHEDPETWQPILLARRDAPAAVQERIAADRRRFVEQVADLLRLGMGELDGDPEVLAEAVLALCEHFGQEILAAPERFSEQQLVDLARGLMRSFRPRRKG